MPRFAIFVDAGYLLSAGGWATLGTWKRAESKVDIPAIVKWIKNETQASAGERELLRLYWYDAAPRREPTPEQHIASHVDDTKLRLGSINTHGRQKGVDALLLADMMDMAVSRAVDLAFLVAGDEDFAEAVRRVQSAGIRLILWGVEAPQNTVAAELRREADRVRMLTPLELTSFFKLAQRRAEAHESSPQEPPQHRRAESSWQVLQPIPAEDRSLDAGILINGVERPTTYAQVELTQALSAGRSFAEEWFREATTTELEQLFSVRPMIPYSVDARLIAISCRLMGVSRDDQIDQDTRIALRQGFWEEIEERVR